MARKHKESADSAWGEELSSVGHGGHGVVAAAEEGTPRQPAAAVEADDDDGEEVLPTRQAKEKAEREAALARVRAQNNPVFPVAAGEMEQTFKLQRERARTDNLANLARTYPEVRDLIAENAQLRKAAKA